MALNPDKVRRNEVKQLTDLPNIGKAGAQDLRLLGIHHPDDLRGRDPYEMYLTLQALTVTRHDPCVLDVFISITRFINGEPARPWHAYTAERKVNLNQKGMT